MVIGTILAGLARPEPDEAAAGAGAPVAGAAAAGAAGPAAAIPGLKAAAMPAEEPEDEDAPAAAGERGAAVPYTQLTPPTNDPV